MDNEKTTLRKELLSLRKSGKCGSVSIEMLKNYPEFLNAKTVFCYISAHGEVETHSLIEELLKEKTVAVPYCVDSNGHMIASKITSLDELKDGKFGIPEPILPKEFPKTEIDFVIVPGVAFDKDGYRLGYGKGYYDRFLCDISPYKLGVCREEFYLEKLPHGQHDIKMDNILVIKKTPKE